MNRTAVRQGREGGREGGKKGRRRRRRKGISSLLSKRAKSSPGAEWVEEDGRAGQPSSLSHHTQQLPTLAAAVDIGVVMYIVVVVDSVFDIGVVMYIVVVVVDSVFDNCYVHCCCCCC